MALQFNPYPIEPWLMKQRSEQRPDFNQTVTQPFMQGMQMFVNARQQAIERERQDMLNKIMLQKEAREQESYDINKQKDLQYKELERRYREAQINALNQRSNAKPPTGYRFGNAGNLEIIPGGPAETKEGRISDKENSLLQGQIQKADLIIGKVDQALPMVSNLSAGFGSIFSNIPMTSAKNLEATIQTIKANLGFQQLQEMRASSPTGGALGQVSDREIGLLTSAVASLDQAQSPQQLRKSLQEIKDSYLRWKENALRAFAQTGQIQSQSRKSATNPNTGEKIYSDDGGQTWHK